MGSGLNKIKSPRWFAQQSGELYYNTGKPCSKGHLSDRVVKNRTCVQCAIEATKEWRQDNKEHRREYDRNYQKAHPLVKRTSEHKRRALKLKAGGTFTSEDIDHIFIKQNGLCSFCKCDLNETGYHIDHKLALSKGGSNWPENLQLLCPTDNVRKWAFSEEDYLKRLAA